jgi:hypothetical protein
MVLTPGPGSDIKPLRFSLAFGASISKREKFSPVSGEEKETRFEIDISTPLLAAPKQSNSLQSQTFCELFPSVLIHCAAIISFIKLLRNTINSNNSSGGGGGNIGGRGGEHSLKTESPTCAVSLDLRIHSVSSGKISSAGNEKKTEFSFRCVVSVFLFNHAILSNFLKLWASFPSRILSNLIPWIFSVPTVWSGISKIGGGSDGGVGGSSGGDGIGGSIGAVETGLAPSAQPLDPLDFETSGFKEKIVPATMRYCISYLIVVCFKFIFFIISCCNVEFSFVKAESNGNLNLVFDNQR